MTAANQDAVSLHELLQMRGDVALAGLKAIHSNMQKLVEGIGAVLAEMERLEAQYKLSDTAGKDAAASLVAAVRRLRPEDTAGKTDEEVVALFKLEGAK